MSPGPTYGTTILETRSQLTSLLSILAIERAKALAG